MDQIKETVAKYQEYVIATRRHFHMNPETSGEEFATQQTIMEELTKLGLSPRKAAGTGVIADIVGALPGKTVALRADIDALPLQDEIAQPYRSQVAGKCHACGHDGHMAMLLTMAKVFVDMQPVLPGNIRLLFQPSEEKFPGGAEIMIADGAMDGVDFVLGTHVWQTLAAGVVGIAYGRMMAAPDEFTINIQGKGGHGSMPQDTICALTTGAEIVCMLNSIVGRAVDPIESAVLSLGMFRSGEVFNITPDSAVIKGTIRSFDQAVRMRVWDRLDQICNGVCQAMGATYTLEKIFGYPPVINNPEVAAVVAEAGRESTDPAMVQEIRPCMGAEDFSYYLQKAPGMFLFLGIGNPATGAAFPHHHPKFDMDESALITGVEVMVRAALKLKTQ
ncbi:MAG: N-acetyldiaminopimelate deacetylase [Firmicutes bacterium]|nr:N-acetyldiaminopimelate deacetylase [Bacillota bacterium]